MIKKSLIGLVLALLCGVSGFAENISFIAKEKDQSLQQEGDCTMRWSPCSTFKIALSLMGYNEGILQDETCPEWPFMGGYVSNLDAWKQTHNPYLWMKNSCVWYSQLLTQKLGMEKFKDYVTKFDYGNKDLSGDPGQDNGLTVSWLSSSLTISPAEQVAFIQKLLANQLPVTPRSIEMTKKILFIEPLAEGWVLYGKTGGGYHRDATGYKQLDLHQGWFVGWIEKQGRQIVFATHTDNVNKAGRATPWAKAFAKAKLKEIVSRRN